MNPGTTILWIRRATLGAILLCVALTVWLLYIAGGGFMLDPIALLMYGWVLLPFPAALPLLKCATAPWKAVALLAGVLLMAAMGVAFYVDGYLNSIDAQAALVFLFVPAMQLCILALVGVALLVAWVPALRKRRQTAPR